MLTDEQRSELQPGDAGHVRRGLWVGEDCGADETAAAAGNGSRGLERALPMRLQLMLAPPNSPRHPTPESSAPSFGKTEKRTHDYVRHAPQLGDEVVRDTDTFVTGQTLARKRAKEFLRFMDTVIQQHPNDQEIHVILDNLATHNNAHVDKWLGKHPHVTFHFTPKGSSWLNQIEIWFGIITRQSIRRGTFGSLAELIRHIRNYIDHWNEDAEPFEWTATADQILEKVAMLDRDYVKLVANNYNGK
jgi:transposase